MESRGDTPTDPPEIVGSSPKKAEAAEVATSLELCVALFAYASDEPGDLSFEAGENIYILKKV
jgi:hypothetical protein